MGLRSILIGLVSLLGALAVVGCSSNKAQLVQPQTRGQRGEVCQARNDCQDGLACLNGLCAKNDFGLKVAPKQCDRVECQADEDCCGDKPRVAPEKCSARTATCGTSTIPGCVRTTCTSDATCGGGTCAGGTCSLLGGACTSDAACKDTCLTATGTCSKSGGICALDSDCQYFQYNAQLLCQTRVCNCTNPAYNPTSPICTDPDCQGICQLRCDAELCVADNSCKKDADCLGVGLPFCETDRCVQCVADTDCDATKDESCQKGQCKKPCQKNEECPTFDECQAGSCVYVGCKSDRECILSAARNAAAVPGAVSSGEDARLLKCLPSEADATISTCKIPCQNDGSCGSEVEICDQGYCKFIGCETDEECRVYLGIQNQMSTVAKPFVPKAVCRQ